MPPTISRLVRGAGMALLVFIAGGAQAYDRERGIESFEVQRTDPAAVRSGAGQWSMTRGSSRWSQFQAANGSEWRVRWNEATGTPHRAFGSVLDLDRLAPGSRPSGPRDKMSILRLSEAFVRAEGDLLGARWEELRPVFASFRGGRWVVTLQQVAQGHDVVGGRVDLRFDAAGELMLFGSDVYPAPTAATGLPRLGKGSVIEAAAAGLPGVRTASAPAGSQLDPQLVLLPMLADEPLPAGVRKTAAAHPRVQPPDLRVRLAYRVIVRTQDPPAEWMTYVDAATGQILWRYDRMRYASVSGTVTGDVHPLNGSDPTTVSVPFPQENLFGGVSTGTVASYGFESGVAGWTSQAPWLLSGESVHAGTRAWSDSPGAQYANNINIAITSPAINIAAVSDPVLEFWTRLATEFEFDFLYVEASADNGTTWKTLRALSGTAAWHQESVDLAAVQGTSTLKVRFRFATDEAVTGDGCWVDDVAIASRGSDVTDASGHYSLSTTGGNNTVSTGLRGSFADIANANGASASQAIVSGGGTLNFSWNASSIASERDVYIAVNTAHARIKQIDPGFTGLDYPLPVFVNTPNYCNAFWAGSQIVVGAGTGASCADLGLWQPVVLHEYCHGITDHVYEPVSDPPGDMHEGFSDYYAATISGEPRVGADIQGPGSMFRTIDNKLRDPEDRGGEVHIDGTIIAGALWDMRKLLLPNVALADSLFQFARYGFPYSYEDYFLELLGVDDNDGNLANGTPHLQQIRSAFGYHGIGYGPEFEHAAVNVQDAASGNGDGRLDAGETASVQVSIHNYGVAETGVYAKLSSPTAGVTVTTDSVFVGAVGAGADVTLPASFGVQIAGSIPVGTALAFNLVVHSSSGFDQDSFMLPVGYVPILLVDDDRGRTFESYYASSLDNLGKRYVRWIAGSMGSPTAPEMAKYRAVIWFTGTDGSTTLTPGDEAQLAAYASGGGHLFVTGENIADDLWTGNVGAGVIPSHGDSLFYRGTLRATVNLASEGSSPPSVNGQAGDVIGNGLSFTLSGGTGANDQTSVSSMFLEPSAVTSLLYSNGRIAALRYTSGNERLFHCGFGFEGVSTQAQRDTLMARALRWLVPSETSAPSVAVVQPNGGEQLVGQSHYTIRWTASDDIAVLSVNLLLSTNGGGSYTPIATGVPNNFAYDWIVNDVSSQNCLVRVEAIDPSSNVGSDLSNQAFRITATTSAEAVLPRAYALHPAVPNPFNPTTRLRFDLPGTARVWLEILSVDGRVVRGLVRGESLSAGFLERAWNGRDDAGRGLPSGVYLVRLRAGDFVATRKIQLLK